MSRFLTFFLVVLLGFLQYEIWFAPDGFKKYRQLSKKITNEEIKLAELSKKNAKLAFEIFNLKHKNEEIENEARVRLGMIKSDETFYQVVD